MYILGISCFYHDSAACLMKDGTVIAAAQEERFTRIKHDASFPINAINYCLTEGNVNINAIDFIGFYDKPKLKFNRILSSYLSVVPKGFRSFLKVMPGWIKKKLWLEKFLKKELSYDGEIIFIEHHQSHAASCFFPSPYDESAILVVDGVGEWATSTYGTGKGNTFNLTHEIRFPHSLGLLYSAFTHYLGFKVNSGEYKVMGLAPYGTPKYYDLIMDNMVDLKDDGSFRLNMKYFAYLHEMKMINNNFAELLDIPQRNPESEIKQEHFDIAMSIQKVTEHILLNMVNHIYEETKMSYLCLAGGVALNSVANGRILRETPFKDIYIHPAAGDAGGALGVASYIYYSLLGNSRVSEEFNKSTSIPVKIKSHLMQTPYLGPKFSNTDIKKQLDEFGAIYTKLGRDELLLQTARLIADKNVVGWFQGRMEWGPRALGNRSILADATDKKMQDIVNQKIKFRESFRPFAPTVLYEYASEYFELDCQSPYMLLVTQVRENKRVIPAATHVDGSARVQTIDRSGNSLYYDLIAEYYNITGVPIIINTSFNVRGEPIVCTPNDAYICFMRTNMDYLVIGNLLLRKDDQNPLVDDVNWQKQFVLD